ncbi:MAG: glycosyltransferase family 2 protein [Candidatus Velamenicoccus archaeovorus]
MSAVVDLVIPTVGRPSLGRLLAALGDEPERPELGRVVVVDDRPDGGEPLAPPLGPLAARTVVACSHGRGPAAARNVGWRACSAPWVAFLDDDVVPERGWLGALPDDLRSLPPDVAGSQGRIHVPLPPHRPPTDRERTVQGLETARWATADMAYRRAVLERVGGFDERFPRAYREDADLGLRVVARGYAIVGGRRRVRHPVRPADPWVSVRLQAGNADDALMRKLHGRGWRARAGVPAGRRPRHLATAAAGMLGLAGVLLRRRPLAVAGLGGLVAGWAELAWARVAPGPRTPREVVTMLVTSAAIPFAASRHWLAGLRRARRLA